MELIPSRVGPTKLSDGGERNKAGIMLIGSSCVRALVLHWAWEYLHQMDMPVTFFLFLVKLCVSGFMVMTERKLFLSALSFGPIEWARLFTFSLLVTLANFFWFEGLKHSGVVRTILTDFGEQTFIFLLSLMFASPSTRLPPMKVKGVMVLAIGYLILCALDPIPEQNGEDHRWWFGVPESYVGGVSLLIAVALNSIIHSLRKTGLEGINSQSLSPLSNAMSCVILAPFALISFARHTDILFSEVQIFSFSFFFFFALIAFSFVMEAKIEATIKQLRQSITAILQIGTSFLFLWLYGAIFGSPSISFTTWSCFFVIIVGLYAFLSSPGGTGEEFLPSFRRAANFESSSSFSVAKVWKFSVFSLQQILANEDSRNIFMFLCLNLAFMFVEMAYGIWSNSLGLISDACHMLFDCVALAIGLFAAVIAKWEANQGFTFGYTRVQVLSGYVNGIFLIYIGLSIFREALHRLVDPPDIQLDKLLIVSVVGLCVNLFGMFAFSHAHSHGGEPCGGGHGGHSHDHGHSHGGGEGTDENLLGVYLHVMADTMGSVGVIISTILIEWFGWTISDPICSLVLAVLILGSVFPLIKSSSRTLLQEPPEALEKNIPEIVDRVRGVEGVVGVKEYHFWKLDANTNVGTMVVEAGEGVEEQGVLGGVTRVVRDFGISNVTIQVNKLEKGRGGEFGGWDHGFGDNK